MTCFLNDRHTYKITAVVVAIVWMKLLKWNTCRCKVDGICTRKLKKYVYIFILDYFEKKFLPFKKKSNVFLKVMSRQMQYWRYLYLKIKIIINKKVSRKHTHTHTPIAGNNYRTCEVKNQLRWKLCDTGSIYLQQFDNESRESLFYYLNCENRMFLKIDDILISLGVILLTSGKGYNCKLDSQSGIIFFFFFWSSDCLVK